jgi:hypothetical protein
VAGRKALAAPDHLDHFSVDTSIPSSSSPENF